jgi:hypothetical protein
VEVGLTPINLTSVMIGIVFVSQLIDSRFFTNVIGFRTMRLCYFRTTLFHARPHPFLPSWTSRKLVLLFFSPGCGCEIFYLLLCDDEF